MDDHRPSSSTSSSSATPPRHSTPVSASVSPGTPYELVSPNTLIPVHSLTDYRSISPSPTTSEPFTPSHIENTAKDKGKGKAKEPIDVSPPEQTIEAQSQSGDLYEVPHTISSPGPTDDAHLPEGSSSVPVHRDIESAYDTYKTFTHHLVIGHRYLHAVSRQPLTLRYIGPIINGEKTYAFTPEGKGYPAFWLGVEYDDYRLGKHSGTLGGRSYFTSRVQGAGVFHRVVTGAELSTGTTLIDAIEARYGRIIPQQTEAQGPVKDMNAMMHEMANRVILGSSNHRIEVGALGMEKVAARLGVLEGLRDMGMDGEWIRELGGDEETCAVLAKRVKRVKQLDLSQNLIATWSGVVDICARFPHLRTLVLNDSRISPGLDFLDPSKHARVEAAFDSVRELNLARSGITWSLLDRVLPRFRGLEELNLHGNLSLAVPLSGQNFNSLPSLLRLCLSNCGITWRDIFAACSVTESLEVLVVSGCPISFIPPYDFSYPVFVNLRSLVMEGMLIQKWSDIDRLEEQLPVLKSLRITLKGIDPNTEVSGPYQLPNFDYENDDTRHFHMTGIMAYDRVFFIATFPELTTLNGTDISDRERMEAEQAYVEILAPVAEKRMEILGTNGTRRWLALERKYADIRDGQQRPSPPPSPDSKLVEDRLAKVSKKELITLEIRFPDRLSCDMDVLPSMPLTSLRKKVAKKMRVAPNHIAFLDPRTKEAIKKYTLLIEWLWDDQDEVIVFYA